MLTMISALRRTSWNWLSVLMIVLAWQLTAAADSGTWTESTGNGAWSSITNWNSGVGPIADGAGNTADFSMVDISSAAVNSTYPGFARSGIDLDSDRTIGNLILGDATPASPGGWEVYTSAVVPAILTLSGGTPTINVSPLGVVDTSTLPSPPATPEIIDDAVIRVGLAGTSGFTKTGLGILTLDGANPNLTGTINVNQGTLRATALATFDFETVTTPAVTQFALAGGATIETAASLGQNAAAGAGVTLAAGTTATITKLGTGSVFFSNVSGAGSTLNFNVAGGTASVDRDWAAAGSLAAINFTGTAITPANVRIRNNGGTFNAISFANTAVNLDNVVLYTNTNSGGNTNSFGSLSGTSTSTLQGGAAGTFVTYQIGGMNTDTEFAGSITTGSGINLDKVGNGKLTLSGNLSYSTTNNGSAILRGGVTRVSFGTLAVSGAAAIPGGITDVAQGNLYTTIDVRAGAMFDVTGASSTYSTAALQQIVGTGTIVGNYIHDEGRIRPADVPQGNGNIPTATAGTITFANDLTFTGSGEIVYDMGLNPAAGNDRIQVNGVTNLGGSSTVVTPNFLTGTVPTSGTYTILNSLGGFNGAPTGWTVTWPGRGAGPTVVTNGTLLQFNAVPVIGGANLNWTGINGSNWDVNTTQNWRNNDTNANDKYFNDDNVTFADTHSGGAAVTNFAVNITTTVTPRSVTVDSTNDYTFSGPGVITGTATFTKRGSSRLTMQKANTFSGAASVEGSIVDIGNFNGALGTGNLTLSNATIIAANTAAAGMTNSGLTLAAGTTNTIQADGTAASTFDVPVASGSGNLQLMSTVQDKFVGIGNMSAFTGNFSASADGVTATAMTVRLSPVSSMPNSAVTLTNGASLANRQGGSVPGVIALGALTGDSTAVLDGFTGGSLLPYTEWRIGNLNMSTEFAGTIIDGERVSGGVATLIPSSVNKVGTETLTLSGVSTYTGDTTVSAGTLGITNPFLADGADVYLAPGSLLNLNFGSFATIDDIDSLFINGVSQMTGTWGGTGSGADHISNLLDGMGLLRVTTYIVPQLLIGDYNNDGTVNAADYTVWRNSLGTAAVLNNRDPLNMGNVSEADYTSWKNNFGATLPGAGSLSVEGSVPEPSALVLAVLVLLPLASGASSRRH
jgi:autotransporter-associated beta strand protein